MPDDRGPLWLQLTLLSDATLGRGDGVAGLVDAEVQHDGYGLPYLSGRTLKGLLTSECAEVLAAMKCAAPQSDPWYDAARFLFGEPGSDKASMGGLHVGDAQLPDDLRAAVKQTFDAAKDDKERGQILRANLDALTALRYQTALDAMGVPKKDTLRTMRVILRETPFTARLDWLSPPCEKARWLLAATCSALRRAGTGRHRGRGRVRALLFEAAPWQEGSLDITEKWLAEFEKEVRGAGTHV